MGTIETDLARRRRVNPILIVVGIVAVVALVIFLLLPILTGGGGEEEPTPPAAAPPSGEGAPTEPQPEEPPPPPPETFEVFEAKDPFRALVSEGEPPLPPGLGAEGESPGETEGAGGAPAPTGGQSVSLLDIFDDDGARTAQVQVGSTVYKVTSGEVFAENYELVSINGQCATFLHGDDKFTLCVGEEVIK